MNRYSPGQGVRLRTVATSVDTPLAPATVALLLEPPSGAVMTFSSPVADGQGTLNGVTGWLFHQDFVIPLSGPPGQWLYTWATGGTPTQSGVDDTPRFLVAPRRF